jgi:hypothetical protein
MPVEHVLLEQREEGLHRGVVPAGADPAHRPDQAVVLDGADEGVRAELAPRSGWTTVPTGSRRMMALRSAATASDAFILESME